MSGFSELRELLDPGYAMILISALACILYGAVRSLRLETDRSPDTEVFREGVSNVRMFSAIAIPAGGSIVLILCLYFLGGMQIIMTISCLFTSSFSLFFLLDPLSAYLLKNKPTFASRAFHISDLTITGTNLLTGVFVALIMTLWYFFNGWFLNNILAFAISVFVLVFLKMPNIQVATVVLIALFFYDIFWVFFSKPVFGTNVMVAVATSLDLPMKFVYPKWGQSGGYCMLGLGDIGFPGLVIVFALRLDRYRLELGQRARQRRRAVEGHAQQEGGKDWSSSPPPTAQQSSSSSSLASHALPPSRDTEPQSPSLSLSLPLSSPPLLPSSTPNALPDGELGPSRSDSLSLSCPCCSAAEERLSEDTSCCDPLSFAEKPTISGLLRALLRPHESHFSITCWGYLAGLTTSYLAVVLTRHAQPALLYLVPGALSALLLYAARCGTVRWVWRGIPETESAELERDELESV